MMPKLVCATTLWSCGLACLESILADNGISKTQAEMIADMSHLFPQWAVHPGVITTVSDCVAVLKGAGLPVTALFPAIPAEAVVRFGEEETVGSTLFINKFYDNAATKQSLIELNHILRVTKADKKGIQVMNPYRCPAPGRFEDYNWNEVLSFKGAIAVFKR